MKQELITATGGASLSITAVTAAVMSVTINEWFALAGIASLILNAAYLVWKWVRESKKDAE